MIELRQSNEGYWSAELHETYIGLEFLTNYYPVGDKHTAMPAAWAGNRVLVPVNSWLKLEPIIKQLVEDGVARPLSATETTELITNTRLPLTEQLRRKETDDGKTSER